MSAVQRSFPAIVSRSSYPSKNNDDNNNGPFKLKMKLRTMYPSTPNVSSRLVISCTVTQPARNGTLSTERKN